MHPADRPIPPSAQTIASTSEGQVMNHTIQDITITRRPIVSSLLAAPAPRRLTHTYRDETVPASSLVHSQVPLNF